MPFDEAFSAEQLVAAYARARRGKHNREEVGRFGWHLERNIIGLRAELLAGTYAHGAYRRFVVSDSKRREIQAAPFRDRVVHQAVVAAIEPIFERRFISDTYACRRGRGTRAGVARFEHFAHLSRYALTMDVSKFFASIDHAILLRILAARVATASGIPFLGYRIFPHHRLLRSSTVRRFVARAKAAKARARAGATFGGRGPLVDRVGARGEFARPFALARRAPRRSAARVARLSVADYSII